jgi:hypothetical protein
LEIFRNLGKNFGFLQTQTERLTSISLSYAWDKCNQVAPAVIPDSKCESRENIIFKNTHMVLEELEYNSRSHINGAQQMFK